MSLSADVDTRHCQVTVKLLSRTDLADLTNSLNFRGSKRGYQLDSRIDQDVFSAYCLLDCNELMFLDCTCPPELPSCVDLLNMPATVLKNKNLWPSNLCYEAFLRQSTRRWFVSTALVGGWEAELESGDEPGLNQLIDVWPLPIGAQALDQHVQIFEGDVRAYTSARRWAVFEEHEEAMWVLRIKVRENALDLFGLAEYASPKGTQVEEPTVVPGELRYAFRGKDTSMLEVVRAAERWWSNFRGLPVQGRPAGSGAWKDADELTDAVCSAIFALRKQGRAATQQEVAAYFCGHTGFPGCDARQLRRWLARYDVAWQDLSTSV